MAENVKQIQTYDGVIHDIEDETARTGLSNTYTKAEADALLATKVDSSEVYDKATLNSILDSKADEANVYSKTEADALLADKANAANVYTKTEADALLADKANAADVYTISQTDGLLAAKASIDDSTTTSTAATWSADKLHTDFQGKADSSDVYTKAEVDALIGGIKMLPLLDFTTPLHSFPTHSTTEDSYTCTQDCYLYGYVQNDQLNSHSRYVTVNDLEITGHGTNTQVESYTGNVISPLPLTTGDVVKVKDQVSLYILKERS